MPSEFVDDANRQTPIRVRASETILHVPFFAFKIIGHSRKKCIEVFGGVRHIYFAPPDLVLGSFVPHNKLVIGRTARMLSGVDDQRSETGQSSLAFTDGMLNERGLGQVPVDGLRVAQTVVFKAISTVGFGFDHDDSFVVIPSATNLITMPGYYCYRRLAGIRPDGRRIFDGTARLRVRFRPNPKPH